MILVVFLGLVALLVVLALVMGVPFQYNARSLLVRKVTTLATALGIALVVFVFAGALMLGDISRVLAAAGRPDTVIILRKGSDAELSSLHDLVDTFSTDEVARQMGEYSDANIRFHQAIINLGKCQLIGDLTDKLPVRVQVQLHKILWGDKPGV